MSQRVTQMPWTSIEHTWRGLLRYERTQCTTISHFGVWEAWQGMTTFLVMGMGSTLIMISY